MVDWEQTSNLSPEGTGAVVEKYEPANLEQMLDRIESKAPGDKHISIGEMLDAVGRRSFGPVLLLVGLILVTPLSGMPGMPTLMGLLVLLTLGQILAGRKHFWLPALLVRREVPRDKLVRGLELLRPAARRVDRLLRPRATLLVKGPGLYVTAVVCMIIAIFMPATEVVPFSSSIAGVALMAFGLAIISRDGVLALFGWTVTVMAPLTLYLNLT